MKAAVTGVFSYSGRFIAEALLARGWEVVALGRGRPAPAERLAERVDFYPLLLDDEEALVTALAGCEALFNTYWVRFEHGGATFAEAIERSRRLFRAASRAQVRRIVHLSVSNASADSPFPYFRGKAAVEDALRRADCAYAILRPTLIFGGREEVLVNNIACLLRHRLVTRDELGALTDNLLACETATTESRFSDWLKANASWLGSDYANELRRNWHPCLSNS